MTTKTFAIALAMVMAVSWGATAEDAVGDPYTLNVCAVTGGELGSMGDPIVIVHEGREIKFCCAGCKPKFEADTAKYLASVDEQVIAQQAAKYPLETCLISGQALDSKGGPVNIVVNNRHVALCCSGCKAPASKNAADTIAKLDKAAIAKQAATYAFDKCAVSGEKLGDNPMSVVVGNHVVQLCCKGCEGKVKANPAKYIAMITNGKMGKVEGSDHK